MTEENKDYMGSGFIIGIVATIMCFGLLGFLNYLDDPIDLMHPNQAINSPELTIDTIKTFNGSDTITTYKFRQLK